MAEQKHEQNTHVFVAELRREKEERVKGGANAGGSVGSTHLLATMCQSL